MIRSFYPLSGNKTKTISGTTTSQNTNLVPSATQRTIQVRVYNASSSIAFVNVGSDNSVTATSANLPVAPGSVEVFTFNIPAATGNNLWVAVVLATGTGAVYLTPGVGI